MLSRRRGLPDATSSASRDQEPGASARHFGAPTLGEAVTDELVRRGDREVALRVADNRGARISNTGFSRLVERAEKDSVLAEKVGLRPDIPAQMFRELLIQGDCGGAAAPARLGQARDSGRNPAVLAKVSQRGRRARARRATTPPRSAWCSASIGQGA